MGAYPSEIIRVTIQHNAFYDLWLVVSSDGTEIECRSEQDAEALVEELAGIGYSRDTWRRGHGAG